MLGKIMKYEWKTISKFYLLLCAFLAVSTFLGCLMFSFPMSSSFMKDGPTGAAGVLYSLTLVGIIILQAIVLIGVLMATYIYSAVRFYKTMYSKQGYLTHTLPVNYHQLVLGKLITNSAWNLIIMIAVIACELLYILCMINWSFRSAMMGGYVPDQQYSSIWSLIGENWSTITTEMQLELGFNIWVFLWLMLISVIISSPFGIMMIYGAITIGQLSAKHKVAMSILSFFAINTVFGVASNIFSIIAMVQLEYLPVNEMGAFFGWLFIPILFLEILTGVALYFISMLIVKKKLNLE